MSDRLGFPLIHERQLTQLRVSLPSRSDSQKWEIFTGIQLHLVPGRETSQV
jgi:hypothetical protein